jgi:multisubunit Na+/H+ antiporter MnhC subunit
MVYFLSFILLLIGLYCILVKKNLLKIIVGLVIVEYAVNLFLVVIGYKSEGHAPIINLSAPEWLYVDPLPQALVLTSIVIGLAVLTMVVAIAIRIYERYGTFDITEIRRLKG